MFVKDFMAFNSSHNLYVRGEKWNGQCSTDMGEGVISQSFISNSDYEAK